MTMLKSCSASSDQAIVCKPGRVGGDERVALTNGPNDREQPFEDDVVQGDRGEAERGDCAQADLDAAVSNGFSAAWTWRRLGLEIRTTASNEGLA